MLRFEDILEKVESYHPHVDEDLLRRAYVVSAHEHKNQLRSSGEPYLVHPLNVAMILAEMKLDEASIAAGLLHDVLEDTSAHEGAPRRAVRPRRRPPRRRGHEDRQVRVHLEGGAAGRDVPQDAPRDDGRPEGHPRQARGPPPQHADARAPAGSEAARRRRRDDGDLRPAREPARDGQDEGRARGPVLPLPLPGGVRRAAGGGGRADDGLGRERREDPAGARREDDGHGHRGRDHGPRETVLVRPPEAHPSGDSARAALRRPRVPHPRRVDPGLLHGPRHRPPGLAPRARAHQGLHRDAEEELLPVPPHDARAGGGRAVRGPDPHARDGSHRRERHRGALEVQGRGGEPRARRRTSASSGRSSRRRRTSRTRASSSPRCGSTSIRTRSTSSARRERSSRSRAARRPSTSRTASTRTWATTRRARA